MATQQIDVYQEPRPSRIIQKAQLTCKLYLLEKARNNLEEELRDFTNQVLLTTWMGKKAVTLTSHLGVS